VTTKRTSPVTARAEIVRLLRAANVTINDQWEGSTGYISETEAGRLADAIAVLSAGHAQTPAANIVEQAARIIHPGAFDREDGSEHQRHEAKEKAKRVLALSDTSTDCEGK
jgi:hypothetical protein